MALYLKIHKCTTEYEFMYMLKYGSGIRVRVSIPDLTFDTNTRLKFQESLKKKILLEYFYNIQSQVRFGDKHLVQGFQLGPTG